MTVSLGHIALPITILLLSLAPREPLSDETAHRISPSSVFTEDEDLVYEVRWTFFKIGTIHIKSLGEFKAIAHIDSYEGLPFVDLHSVHYAEMDSAFCSLGGYAIDKDGENWKGLHYTPDQSTRRVAIEQLYQKAPTSPPYKREPKDTIQLESNAFVDGLSIGYFPRLFLHAARTVNMPTLLKGKVGTTTFYFTNTRTTESISALDDPVRVVEVEGTTSAVGVFGMTGEFTGWFSDDEAAVPIKGKLKVILGSVTVELIKWNRKDWKPPQ
ncbi:MAG: hypothetical protein HW412_765 [Bacteroidetes bacterium]|nr:hypothetical protein [Bacteroidota bacterium]